jgi:hypothetical protein
MTLLLVSALPGSLILLWPFALVAVPIGGAVLAIATCGYFALREWSEWRAALVSLDADDPVLGA